MAFWVNHLMGDAHQDFPLESLPELYDELIGAEGEHTDVSLTHESEWSLAAFSSGLVVWENVAGEGAPKHMVGVSRDKVLGLWKLLAAGEINEIDREPWVMGYGR